MNHVAILICFYAGYTALAIVIFAVALRRSEYGVLIGMSELTVFLGCGLYPIFFYSGFITPGTEGEAAINTLGLPGYSVAAHVLLYGVGATLGYAMADKWRVQTMGPRIRWLSHRIAPTMSTWRVLLAVALGVWGIFFALVGLDKALANAIVARMGDLEGFEEGVGWVFLKTFGQSLLIIATCVVPLALKRGARDWIFIGMYLLLVLITFANSLGRGVVLTSVITPVLVYVWSRKSITKVVGVLTAGAVIGVPVLLYAKSLGFLMRDWLGGDEVGELVRYQGDGFFLETLLRNAEFVWYSVYAGVNRFFERGGPLIVADPAIAALFGFVPSRVLEALGFGAYYYGGLEVRLACVNTAEMGLEGCTTPTQWIGYSGYVLPWAGAWLAGFSRFAIFGVLEKVWRVARNGEQDATWLVYFLHLLSVTLMTLVPFSIAQVIFALWLLVFLFSVKSLRALLIAGKATRITAANDGAC